MELYKTAQRHEELRTAAMDAQRASGVNSPRLAPGATPSSDPVPPEAPDTPLPDDLDMDLDECESYLAEMGVDTPADMDLATKRLLVREYKDKQPKRARV